MVSKINKQTNTLSINTISRSINTDGDAIVPYEVTGQGATYFSCFKYYAVKSLRQEILSIYIRQLIYFNKSKFEQRYIQPLVNLVKTIYNKNIQFNLVDLKYLYFNSDIFSETLIIKLKNRKNNILTVLDKSLQMFTLPDIDKLVMHNDIYIRKKRLQNLKVDSFTNNEDLKVNRKIYRSEGNSYQNLESHIMNYDQSSTIDNINSDQGLKAHKVYVSLNYLSLAVKIQDGLEGK
jgi:hypothetical protein